MVIKDIMNAIPGCRLALVGDGPQRTQLEEHFQGMPVTFMVGVIWGASRAVSTGCWQ
jgi:hypothetical protein